MDTRLVPRPRPSHQALDSRLVRCVKLRFADKCNMNYTPREFTSTFGVSVYAVADLAQKYEAHVPSSLDPLLHALAYYHSYPKDLNALARSIGSNVRDLRLDCEAILDLSWEHFNEIKWESMMQYPIPTRGALGPSASCTHRSIDAIRSLTILLQPELLLRLTPLLGSSQHSRSATPTI